VQQFINKILTVQDTKQGYKQMGYLVSIYKKYYISYIFITKYICKKITLKSVTKWVNSIKNDSYSYLLIETSKYLYEQNESTIVLSYRCLT